MYQTKRLSASNLAKGKLRAGLAAGASQRQCEATYTVATANGNVPFYHSFPIVQRPAPLRAPLLHFLGDCWWCQELIALHPPNIRVHTNSDWTRVGRGLGVMPGIRRALCPVSRASFAGAQALSAKMQKGLAATLGSSACPLRTRDAMSVGRAEQAKLPA